MGFSKEQLQVIDDILGSKAVSDVSKVYENATETEKETLVNFLEENVSHNDFTNYSDAYFSYAINQFTSPKNVEKYLFSTLRDNNYRVFSNCMDYLQYVYDIEEDSHFYRVVHSYLDTDGQQDLAIWVANDNGDAFFDKYNKLGYFIMEW